MKLSDISNLSVREAKQFIENEGCVMFEVEHQMIKQERDNLISFCNSFYTQLNKKYCNDLLIFLKWIRTTDSPVNS